MKKPVHLAIVLATSSLFGAMSIATRGADAVTSGDWSASGTWTPAEPTTADSAIINGGFTVGVSQAGEVATFVDVANASGQTGTLSVTAGDLTVSGGGIPSIRVGQAAGGTGVFNMSGGAVNINGAFEGGIANGDLMIGDVGTGTLNLSGGTLTASDEILIGPFGSSQGIVNISGGVLQNSSTTGRATIAGFGTNGVGRMNLSGSGTLHTRFDLVLGLFDASQGHLTLADNASADCNFLFASRFSTGASSITQTGGTLTARFAIVLGTAGGSSTTATHSAGTMSAGTDFVVGDSGSAIYNLSGSAVTTVVNNTMLGVFPSGNGTVNQSGGSITSGVLDVGKDGAGTWTQTAGNQTATNAFLGDFDTSLGTYKVSGGTFNVQNNFSIGGALASNAPGDAGRVGDQGQALDAKGVFIVRGSAATINIGGDLLANPADKTRAGTPNAATLVFEILDSGGTSLIHVVSAADLDGAVIDLDLFSFTPSNGQVFNLLEAVGGIGGDTGTGTTKVNGSTGEAYSLLAEDVGAWNLRVVSGVTPGSEILQAVYVPEPATLAVLGGLLVLGRRRHARE